MTKRKQVKRIVLGLCLAGILWSPVPIYAQESVLSQDQVYKALEQASASYLSLEKLRAQSEDLETLIQQIQGDLSKKQEEIGLRKDFLKERLRSIQLAGISRLTIDQLLSSQSLSDLMERWYLIEMLFESDQEAIGDLAQEVALYQTWQADLLKAQELLTQNLSQAQSLEATYQEQLQKLDDLVVQVDLQPIQAQNQGQETNVDKDSKASSLVSKLSQWIPLLKGKEESKTSTPSKSQTSPVEGKDQTSLTTQETSLEVTSQEKSTASTTTQVTSKEAEKPTSQAPTSQETTTQEPIKETPSQAPRNPEPSASQGKTLTVTATAYSMNQAGLSNWTAAGIDLRQNPMVIAVDPSVIPLGSLVEVPGYGIAIAGDTGSAIKGNKIDLHYTDLNQAIAYGRQSIQIRVISQP